MKTMLKTTMSETVALKKSKQGSFTKQVKNVKKKVSKGIIKVQEDIRKRKKPKTQLGLVYVGHLPHGFYEEEMNEYFKQFGRVTNVRVCRSRKTGKSKGYGFVQFRHPEVAKVAAETMDNYLMFNRRVICKYIPPEKQARILFKRPTWSTDYFPLKISRKLHIKKRNENVPDEKLPTKAKKVVNKIKKKMNKLKQLGITHTFMPSDMTDDTQQLLDKEIRGDGHKNISTATTDDTKRQKMKVSSVTDVCKDLKKKTLKSIQKKKDKLNTKSLPNFSFMQNDRLKRLAAGEIVNDVLVKRVNKIKSKKLL